MTRNSDYGASAPSSCELPRKTVWISVLNDAFLQRSSPLLMSALGRKLPLATTRNLFPTGGHLCLRLVDAASDSSAHRSHAKGHRAEQLSRAEGTPISPNPTRTL